MIGVHIVYNYIDLAIYTINFCIKAIKCTIADRNYYDVLIKR